MALRVNLLHSSCREAPEGRYYTAAYQVLTESSDPNLVVQKAGLPIYGEGWGSDAFSHVTTIETAGEAEKLNDDGTTYYRWVVLAHYTPRDSNVAPEIDPTDEKPRVRIGSVVREIVVEKDLDDAIVDNSAGDPFDPPIVDPVHDDHLSVTVNIAKASFNMATTMAFKDSCNNAGITICNYVIPQYAGLMVDIPVEPMSRNGTDYWAVSYEIQITRREGLWEYRPMLDQGFEYIDASDSNTKKKFKDKDDQPVSEPKLLKADGDELAAGGTPNVLEFRTKERKNWSTLSIPTSSF